MLLPQPQALLLAWWLRECRKLFRAGQKKVEDAVPSPQGIRTVCSGSDKAHERQSCR